MTVWACWIALYSAVVHGRKTRLTALVVALLAAVARRRGRTRDLLLRGRGIWRIAPQRGRSARLQRRVHRPSDPARPGSPVASGTRARARRTDERAPERAGGERPQRGARGAGADRARAARRRRPPRQRDGRAGRRGAARHGAAARQGRGGPQLDRGLQPAGRARAAPPARRAPPCRSARRAVAAAGSGPAARAHREGRAGRADGRALDRGRAAAAASHARGVRVSRHPGSAHQCSQALRRDDRHGARRLPAGDARGRGARRRQRERAVRGHRRRARTDGHARARRPARRPPARGAQTPGRVRGACDVPAQRRHT